MTQNKKFPLMPKATAIWLIDNTTLTFKQIADFCGMHELEVKGIADGEVAVGVIADNPITSGQLDKEEIERCCKDPNAKLQLKLSNAYETVSKAKKKGAKVKMLVDTGSNISGLDRKLIDMLQLPSYEDKASVDGAGGIASLSLFRCVVYMNIFKSKALPIDIVEGNFENAPYHGILGRDVLQFCTFHFDGPSNCFRLAAPGF
jgi:predicted aspartyl protease